MVIQPLIYKLNAMSIKVPLSFLAEIEKSILKFICNQKRPQWQKKFSAKRTSLETTQCQTSNYTADIGIKNYGTGTKTDIKTSGREDPEINSHSYSHLIFDKGAKNIHWRKSSLSQMVL
jgi:hypothetical protein